MSFNIINVDTPRASLTCRDGQMICRADDGSPERRLPLEDVASVIITSFSATLHSHFAAPSRAARSQFFVLREL